MPSLFPNPTHLALHAARFDMKGFKTWSGMEGGGYQFTLLYEGMPVATVTEDGSGGPLRVEWHGVSWNGGALPLSSEATPAQKRKAAAQVALTRKAKAALADIVAAIPPINLTGGFTINADEEIVLGSLAEVADIRKLTKKKTVFAKGDKLYTFSAPFSPAVAAHLAAKHPNATVLNTIPVYVS